MGVLIYRLPPSRRGEGEKKRFLRPGLFLPPGAKRVAVMSSTLDSAPSEEEEKKERIMIINK